MLPTQMCFSFPVGTFFPSSANTHYLLVMTQNFDKSVTGVVKKTCQKCFLSKGRLNFWVKCSEPKKQITKKFSELQQLEVGFRVQPNIPIVILILLTGFYRFLKYMGPNTSGTFVGLPYLQPSKMIIFTMASTFCEK